MKKSTSPLRPDYSQAVVHALHRLQSELSPQLTYHNIWHTKREVVPSAVLLAQHSNLPKHEIRLLEVAAAYHDMGFIFTCTGHEQISIEIMSQSLPAYGFGLQEMEQIAGMIRATQLPQSPHNLLEQILADADLDILGRENFFERNKALWQELTVCGEPVPWDEWLESQVQFLKNHTYFTPAARALRDTTKQKHIAALEKQIHQNL